MLSLSLATINSVLMILMMGIFLVPSLLFEEKETKTMQALLVSPASIGQVVIAKALAGSFYMLVTAVTILAISWADVVHWDMAVLFVIGGGIFSVAVGLVLGSFYEKQQDMVGWITVLLLLFLGAIIVKMLNVELPTLVEYLLPWVPSVALAEISGPHSRRPFPFPGSSMICGSSYPFHCRSMHALFGRFGDRIVSNQVSCFKELSSSRDSLSIYTVLPGGSYIYG